MSIDTLEKLSLICHSHLQQLGMFLWRNGLEIYPLKDFQDNSIAKYINNFFDYNKIALYYEDIWFRGAISGEILIYLLPLKPGYYRFLYYPKNNFEYSVNDLTGDIEKVCIKVNYKVYEVSKDFFKTWYDESKYPLSSPDKTVVNDYNILPCVLIKNKPSLGNRGLNEFSILEKDIQLYNSLIYSITTNIQEMGHPLFYSTLSKAELIQQGLSNRPSVADAQGYGQYSPEIKKQLKKVLSGLEKDDVVNYLNPETVSNPILNWVNDLEATIRYSLGGVPYRLPPNDALFNESDIAYRYAPVIHTSKKRAGSYITYGLVEVCKLALTMSSIDKTFLINTDELNLKWRYTGDIFPSTSSDRLSKSIVARNLIRLGVNLVDAMQHIFPDLSRLEIEKMLEGGFAYEYLNGMSLVTSKFNPELHQEIYKITQELILKEVAKANDGRI